MRAFGATVPARAPVRRSTAPTPGAAGPPMIESVSPETERHPLATEPPATSVRRSETIG